MSFKSNSEGLYRGTRSWCHTHFKEYKGSLTWRIDGFSQCEYQNGKCLTSPYFGIDGKEEHLWNLLLYPRGKTHEKFVAVFLHSTRDKTTLDPVECEISIVDVSGKMTEKKKWDKESDGWEDFICRSSLFDAKDVLLPQDVLTIYCEIVAVKKQEKSWISGRNRPRSLGGDVRSEETLSSDIGHMLQKDKFSDVVLQVGDTKIPAHKVVLMARSSVFAEMFQQDKQEDTQTTNTVVIKDIEVQVFRELLSFIYSNECDLFTVQFAVHLFAAAERYAVLSLRTKCSQYINDNLSAKLAFEAVVGFGGSELRKKCSDSLCNELSNLATNGVDWKSKLPSNPEVLEDIFKNFADKEKSAENFSVASTSAFSSESKASFEHTRFVDRWDSLLWKIDGFSICRHLENRTSLFSMKFGIEKKFCLSLYPKGRNIDDEGFMTWYFRAESPEPVRIKLRVRFKNTNGEEIFKSWANSIDLAKYNSAESGKLIAVEKLFGDNSLLPNDELVVSCFVGVSKMRTEQHCQVDCKVNSMADDFAQTFDKQVFTDAVLEMKEDKILAHKLVLWTRSSLLDSSDLNFIDTKDHLLKELVRYLYTDTCTLKNSTDALDMLQAAHKYDVPSLQAKCCKYLCDNLSEHSVFDIVVSAFSLKEIELYKNCLDYMRHELPSVSFLPWRLKQLHAHPDIFKDAIGRFIA